MAPVRPMMDNLELQYVQEIVVDGKQVLVQHGVPALEGDFLKSLGRRGYCITITGVLTGIDVGKGLICFALQLCARRDLALLSTFVPIPDVVLS